MTEKPPSALPSQLLPMVDVKTGLITEGWYGYFANVASTSTPFELITVGVTPFTFIAVHSGSALIIGGAVSSVGLKRGRVLISPIGLVAGFIPMSQNDKLIIDYSGLPTLWYLPNGNPS